jgi:NO-binding membrane sensor protein with MHYT domain
MRLYRRAVVVFSIVIAILGAALLVVTAAHGGGAVGFLVGGLFVALGVARFTLERKRGPL